MLKIESCVLGIVLVAGLISCNNDEPSSKGYASISITDAAVDAENVSEVHLSVNEIKATSNNETNTVIMFDEPEEFNLMAYQNGDIYYLGDGELEAGAYSDIRLILSETSPSYIEFKDGSREEIIVPSGTSSGYKIKGDFVVNAESTVEIVADVDLRKALVLTGEGTYMLRPTARLIDVNTTGTIEGTVEGTMISGEQYVVLAYEAGTYDETEDDEPLDGRTRFEGAVNSAHVAADGSYTLAFMEPGEYELIVVKYNNIDDDEDLEYLGEVSLDIKINEISRNTVNVSSDTYVVANIVLL